jgi:phosphoenolpyruvate carboxykinase (GTP)
MIQRDTIFTNVAVTEDNQPWWEGLDSGTAVKDWQGKPYTPGSGHAAHPNARFTVSAKQNPIYSTLADAPEGVPISAILFGGRRREVAPLVYEARSWSHGVLVGAGMASETTAAAVGQMGVVRRDSMAMKPFCGYNFGDYWKHWLSFEGRASKLPRIFHVNWFRQDKNGRFMWPGYGENLRVLRWVTDRCDGRVEAQDTPIGFVPRKHDLDVTGLNIDAATVDTLLSVDPIAWRHELESIGKYLDEFRERVPAKLREELRDVQKRLG